MKRKRAWKWLAARKQAQLEALAVGSLAAVLLSGVLLLQLAYLGQVRVWW